MNKKIKTIDISKNKDKQIVLFMFILSSCVFFAVGTFHKSIFIINDELFYLEAARSIAHGNGMVYNGIVSPFQKVLYSFLISPAFLIDNHEIQMTLVSLINAVCTASSVFPSYLLAKESGLVKQKRYAFCVFVLIFPETLNYMGFMSEVLYYPLWIWVLYFVYRSIRRDSVTTKESILLGILAYLLYMTKEVGVIALPMYVAIELLYYIRKESSNRRIIQCVIACITFALCFVIAKLTIFSQTTGGSYVIKLDNFNQNTWTVPFYFYAVLYYLVYVILSLYIFPVFFPPEKKSVNRKFYYYTFGCIFALIMVITYMITIHEDYLLPSPRLHIRYLAPLTVPFILFFLSDSNWCICDGKGRINANVKLLIIYVIILAIIPPLNIRGLMDSKGIEIFRLIGIVSERIFTGNLAEVLYFIGLKTICILLIVLGYTALKKKKELFTRMFALAVVVICILSSIVKIYEIRSLYSIEKGDMQQAIEADEMLDELDGRKIWILREVTDPIARLAITYHDNRQSDFTCVGDSITEEIELMAGGAIKKAEISDYSYICIDKQLIEQNKTILGEYSNEVVWSSDLFEIRRVKCE